MEPQGPQNSNKHDNKIVYGDLHFNVTQSELQSFKGGHTLLTVANICGILSLFFGGVLLSVVGLVSGILGFVRYDTIGKNHPDDPRIRASLRKNGLTSIIICAVALVLNVAMLIVMAPVLTQIAQTGDYSVLFGNTNLGGGSSQNIVPNGSQTWG